MKNKENVISFLLNEGFTKKEKPEEEIYANEFHTVIQFKNDTWFAPMLGDRPSVYFDSIVKIDAFITQQNEINIKEKNGGK